MKAFQLKIVIKNSKPPIWRRVIVPSGITFSQLSIIINEVMGWCGYHAFDFEFYHKKVRLSEDVRDLPDWYDEYDYLEASETFIREYLEENDWFTYIYDLGDDWQHRVTIEKVLENYEYNYPQVIKYKGDCPVEDCGGIYGYYECLDIISDKNHPEYEARLEWMERQGYPNEYDMEYVNQTLRESFFYTFGKADKRHQNEIYEDYFSGKYGLRATKRDKNKVIAGRTTEQETLDEAFQRFDKIFAALREYQEAVSSERNELSEEGFPMGQETLNDIFNDFEKTNIKEIARNKGLVGVSNLKKEKLIDKLVTHMLRPEIMKKYLLCLTDDEIAEFENACKEELYLPDEAGLLLPLYEAAYIGMLPDGRVTVPHQVREVYETIKGAEFDRERKRRSYVLCCLRTAGLLYGIVPLEVFEKLIAQNVSEPVTAEELEQLILEIPPEWNFYIVAGDMIYRDDLFMDDGGLLDAQGDLEYYIPTLKEIMDYGTKGYETDNRYVKRLERLILKKTDAMPEEAEVAARLIQINIMEDCEMQENFTVFEEMGIEIKNKQDLNGLVGGITDLWNHTRKMSNRGFTPSELAEKKRRPELPENRTNVIDFPVARKPKV